MLLSQISLRCCLTYFSIPKIFTSHIAGKVVFLMMHICSRFQTMLLKSLIVCIVILLLTETTAIVPARAFSNQGHTSPKHPTVRDFGHSRVIPLSDYYPTGQFTLPGNCDKWTYGSDAGGYLEFWTNSTGSQYCAKAQWNLNGYYSFNHYFFWVPSSYANTTICIGFYSVNTRIAVGCVDENNYTDQWAPIPNSSNLRSVSSISLSSNDGHTNDYIGCGDYNHSLKVSG
jgi:hypothetical protein